MTVRKSSPSPETKRPPNASVASGLKINSNIKCHQRRYKNLPEPISRSESKALFHSGNSNTVAAWRQAEPQGCSLQPVVRDALGLIDPNPVIVASKNELDAHHSGPPPNNFTNPILTTLKKGQFKMIGDRRGCLNEDLCTVL
jgi:hypothetical protein